ncbi:MAG: hypothetical protein KJN66_09005 [Bacteroidia bacterium]|nr:hypothetical protein [Bacteroidia bacterium]
MKYLIKNSINQDNQNYAIYNRIGAMEYPLKKVSTIFSLTKFLGVIKKYYRNYVLYNGQAFVVHPNQRVNTNLNWTEILKSN